MRAPTAPAPPVSRSETFVLLIAMSPLGSGKTSCPSARTTWIALPSDGTATTGWSGTSTWTVTSWPASSENGAEIP
jgi:hypothetical protein